MVRFEHSRLTPPALAACVVALAVALLAPGVRAQPLPAIGLSAAFAQIFEEQGTYPHSPGAVDYFGFAVAAGDFNGDGFDDLASGIPGNDCDFVTWDCGAVQVRFGWSVGALGSWLTLDPRGTGPNGELPPEPAHAFDSYGAALAVGDFQNDGYDDLVVGMPVNYNTSGTTSTYSGAVHIHYGLPGALGSIQWVAEHVLWQGHSGDGDPVPGDAHFGERFGAALAVGDFDGDGHDDLAIGDPQEGCRDIVNGCPEAGRGSVLVAHGHIGGLVPFGGFEMRQGLAGLPDVPEHGEQFGHALAAGDFNADGFDDLAIGVPSEDDVGAVLVVYGSPISLIFAWHWYFGQIDLGDTPHPGDRFGAALAVGDFDGDGFDDLAIGAPQEDAGPGVVDSGQVTIVYGGLAGLSANDAEALWEDRLYGAGRSEPFDNFGSSLAAGDFNGDGIDDLAIGTLGENGTLPNIGAVDIVLGRRPRGMVGSTARKLFPRGTRGILGFDAAGMIPDHQEGEPFWGFSLAVGDFDGNHFADLAIGAANRNTPGPSPLGDSGAVAVLFGQLFADGFEGGDTREWSATTP